MLKLNQLSKFKYLLITLCALFLAHRVFAYGEDYDRGHHEQSNEQKIEELQESIKELSKDIEEDRSEVDPLATDVKVDAIPKDIKTLNANPSKMRKAIKMINSQFKYMPEDEVKKMLHSSLEGKPFAGFLVNSESFINFMIGMLKDDKALLYLFELTQDKKVMKLALFVIVGLIILNFFLKRLIIKKDDFVLLRFIKGLFFFIFSTALKVGVLYFLYQDYLQPTVDVFIVRVLQA